MGKAASNGFIDGGLNAIDGCTSLTVCSAEPANQAGIAAVALADVTIDGSDFTTADGDTSGRKVTISAQNNITIDTSGTATHVVIDDSTDIYVTTCTSQGLTSGGTVTVPAWDIEIADPT